MSDFVDFRFNHYDRNLGYVKDGFWIKGKPTVAEVLAYLEESGYDVDSTYLSGSSVQFEFRRPPTQDELDEDARKLQHFYDNQEKWERQTLARLLEKYGTS